MSVDSLYNKRKSFKVEYNSATILVFLPEDYPVEKQVELVKYYSECIRTMATNTLMTIDVGVS